MNFIQALTTLESQNCRIQDAEQAYKFVLRQFECEATNLEDEDFRNFSRRLLKLLCRDTSNPGKTVDVCLKIIHHCFSTSYFRSSQNADSAELLQALISCAQKTQSVAVMRLCLACLATQHFNSSVVTSQVGSIIDMLEGVNTKVKSQSGSVLEESLNLLIRLEEQVPDRLKTLSQRWARLILPGLVTSSEEVKLNTYNLLIKFKKELQDSPELSKHVIKAITTQGLATSLKLLMAKYEIHAIKTWALVIDICGKELHKGPSINALLEIIEIAFKSTPESKCQAFIAWRSLISNFGLDKTVISDPKRIKLLTMVFRYDNAKTEPVAVEKMKTWWHFLLNVDQKHVMNFEKTVYPMLQFCVGSFGTHTPSRIALKPSTPNLQSSMMSPQSKNLPDHPSYPAVQKLGLEAIALLLSKPGMVKKDHSVTWALDHLPYEVFGGSTAFAKHAMFLLKSIHQIFRELRMDLKEPLVVYTWSTLATHIRVGLEGSSKTEFRDIFSTFLTNFHHLVEKKVFGADTLFKMVDVCSSFPVKILASTAFNVSCTVRGSPALLLSEVMLNPAFIEANCNSESYLRMFSLFVSAGASNVQGALVFLQTVTELLDSNSMSVSSAEVLLKMWNTITQTLQETIISSNEVNQGDALEYNFGCMCAVLLFPIKQQLASRVLQTACKSMTKMWKELYHSFARMSALVTTAEANTCLEETCNKILHKWLPEFKDPSNLEFLSSLAHKMLDCVDFSAFLANQSTGAIMTLSPSKWSRRRQRPLGSLHSFVHLLDTIQKHLNTLLFSEEGQKHVQNKVTSTVTTANTMVEVYTRLFMHVNTTSLISHCLASLAGPMSSLFKTSLHCNVRLFVPSFLAKLDKLWQEVALCVGGRYSEAYTSDLLAWLSPLFEVTFLHSRRAIKNQALALWNMTFSRAHTLEYPSDLKPVLVKVKEKLSIVLPGWITPEDLGVIAESPFSEMSMGCDSEIVAPPVLSGMPSPKRPRGSMLNKDLSPVRKDHASPPPGSSKFSPAKVMTPKEVRKLFSPAHVPNAVDQMSEKDFVVISSSATKKKRLLTEHQKEVLKEKSVLPAMYNNLDASQDVSLMSQFVTETQTESSLMNDVIVVNSSQDQKEKSHVTLMQPPKTSDKLQTTRRRSERILSKESSEASDSETEGKAVESTSDIKSSDVFKPETPSKQDDCVDSKKTDNVASNSPFVMFRQKRSASPPLSLSQDEESKGSKRPARRVTLRKVASEDSVSHSEKTEFLNSFGKSPFNLDIKKSNSPQPQKKLQPSTNKSPFELEIKKNDSPQPQKKLQAPTSKSPFKLEIKKSDSPQPLKKATYSADDGALPSFSAESAFSKVTESSQKKQESTQAPAVSPSHMLVEDTQSPDQVKKQAARQSQSITETPTKSDDSLSPHLRTSSARKLFADDGPLNKLPGNSAVQSTPVSSKQKALPEEQTDGFDEVISSSQGFDPVKETTQTNDAHTMFGFSQLLADHDQHKLLSANSANEKGSTQEPIVINDKESENAMSGALDSDNFLSSMMPTLASQLRTATSQISSSKSSTSTPSTPSNSSASRHSSSEEADFFPVQSTLQEDSVKDVNKRKKSTPKKYSPERPKKRARRQQKNEHLQANTNVSATDSVNKASGTKENHTDHVTKVPETVKTSLENGEITPDIKSPATPQRGHSSIKRKRRSSQNVETPKARKNISPEVEKQDSEHSELEGANLQEDLNDSQVKKRKKVLGSDIKKHMLRTRSKTSTSSPPKKLRKLTDNRTAKRDVKEMMPVIDVSNDIVVCSSDVNSESEDDTPLARFISKEQEKNTDACVTEQTDCIEDNHKAEDVEEIIPLTNLIKSTKTAVINDKQQNATCENLKSVEVGSNEVSTPCHASSNVDTPVEQVSNPILSPEERAVKVLKYDIVDKTLSLVLPQISRNALCPQTTVVEDTAMAGTSENTPLLMSEDVMEVDNVLEESQDHLQAGQSNHDAGADNPSPDVKENGEADQAEFVTSDNTSSETITCRLSKRPTEENEQVEVGTVGDQTSAAQVCVEKTPLVVGNSPTKTVLSSSDNETKLDHAESMKDPEEDVTKQLETSEETETAEKDGDGSADSHVERSAPVTLHDWSPSKSPSFSILKKKAGSPSPGRNRVSFAEPVVNGESPVREKYQHESVPTSPLVSKSTNQRKGTPFARSIGRVSGYRRRLNQSGKQQQDTYVSPRTVRGPANIHSSPQHYQCSPSQFKATQESQLDGTNPIFPDLTDCQKPVDDILHQLTSSLWYRGLHHLMKGRNLNTIGDLASLTEVQVNQLPIRHPKIDIVRTTLKAYMAQHGLFKPLIKLPPVLNSPEKSSDGATLEQAVTPSSIADEGIKIRSDNTLDRLSPIEATSGEMDSQSSEDSETASGSSTSSINTESADQTRCSTAQGADQREKQTGVPGGPSSLQDTLARLDSDCSHLNNNVSWSSLSLSELFDVHQKLNQVFGKVNQLFGKVVDEIKTKQPQGSS